MHRVFICSPSFSLGFRFFSELIDGGGTDGPHLRSLFIALIGISKEGREEKSKHKKLRIEERRKGRGGLFLSPLFLGEWICEVLYSIYKVLVRR